MKAAGYAWSHTAAPMLSGTLVTIIGFTPVGFAQLHRGRVRRQHFLDSGLCTHLLRMVAVVFTPYLGVKLLHIAPVAGGHAGILLDAAVRASAWDDFLGSGS